MIPRLIPDAKPLHPAYLITLQTCVECGQRLTVNGTNFYMLLTRWGDRCKPCIETEQCYLIIRASKGPAAIPTAHHTKEEPMGTPTITAGLALETGLVPATLAGNVQVAAATPLKPSLQGSDTGPVLIAKPGTWEAAEQARYQAMSEHIGGLIKQVEDLPVPADRSSCHTSIYDALYGLRKLKRDYDHRPWGVPAPTAPRPDNK